MPPSTSARAAADPAVPTRFQMTALRTRAAALLLIVAGAFAAPAALATEPSDAQVDRLIETMDMPRMLGNLLAQMDAMNLQMGERFMGEGTTPEQRERIRQTIARQQAGTRNAMSWEKIGPIYRNVYRKLFTAEEIDAMIAFYGSPAGRSILQKMPKAMELAMEDMQPIMETLIADLQKELEKQALDSDEGSTVQIIEPPPR